jgi:hypothetical protein
VRHPFDPARFRRIVAGLSLLAAPLCGLAWSLLVPPFTAGMAGEVAFIAAHPGRWALGTYLGVVWSYLMIPAVLGLLHLFRARAVVLGHVGGALALTGAAFHGTMLGFQLAETPIVLSGIDRARAVALTSALTEQPAFTALLVPLTGLFLGLLLLALALWRARAAPAWIAALLVAAVAVEIAGPPAFKARLFFTLLLAALGWVGVALLRMSDAEWRHAAVPPSPRGSAAGAAAAAPV